MRIHELAAHGLDKVGHHGFVAAMGVPRQDLPSWDAIQFVTAQLSRLPLLDDVLLLVTGRLLNALSRAWPTLASFAVCGVEAGVPSTTGPGESPGSNAAIRLRMAVLPV